MIPACPVTTRFEKMGMLVNHYTTEVTQKISEHQHSAIRWVAALDPPLHREQT